MIDVRKEFASRRLRPVQEHAGRIAELGTKLGVPFELAQERIAGGPAHGGVLVRGVKVNGKFVPLEAEKKVDAREAVILKKLSKAKTEHLRVPRIIKLSKGKAVMEFVPGRRLKSFTEEYDKKFLGGHGSRKDFLELASLFETAARGLKELHSLDIVKGHLPGPEDFESELHGGNFIIGDDGHLYWVDFSAAEKSRDPHRKFMDFEEFFQDAFTAYGGNAEKSQLAKINQALHGYLAEGASPHDLVLLSRFHAVWRTVPEVASMIEDNARDILRRMPPAVRSDFIKDFWKAYDKAQWKPPKESRFAGKVLDRLAEQRQKWRAVIDSAK